MIFNTTHTNKDAETTINDLVGARYSFIEAIKMKGVGSKRMVVTDVSQGFKNVMNTVSDINYANIEIRKKGILIHINKGLKNFSWAIPFYQLYMYKTNGFSIHAQGNFVRFTNNKLLKENKKFIAKLVDLKIENNKNYESYNTIN
ncbi:hypothetical protein JL193_04370 [Polaribacter batillariae]|uniref:Arginyl-tRNA synthetase n=1 Tax=Polaribacter batillariae TaxID=2808900 RepID=A0ABX7SW95_9FLAO|nr:hypothetical protein [Polaribacter batillariae]QTD38529.1 hypothetical protein JL193_04370 [Polaribacter batillariae]